jgi:hypothetical protein
MIVKAELIARVPVEVVWLRGTEELTTQPNAPRTGHKRSARHGFGSTPLFPQGGFEPAHLKDGLHNF